MFYDGDVRKYKVPEYSRQRQFFGVKSEYFFRAASDIGFCVFPRLDSSQGVSERGKHRALRIFNAAWLEINVI